LYYYVMKAAERQFTFGLVPGFGHNAWCWDYVVPELRMLGHQAIASELPIGDPQATFDDYAEIVRQDLAAQDNIVLVGHSRGANVIPRVAANLRVARLVYVCGSFDKATSVAFGENTQDDTTAPPKYSPQYEAGLHQLPNGLWELTKPVARRVYYNGCSDEVRLNALTRLRPQRRSDDEPPLKEMPDAPADYILCRSDLALNPAWSRHVARQWLGVEPIELEADHSPFLSRPVALARKLVELASMSQEGVSS
jgi:pimeloyl-ACP methyl ester carboxylesterase